MPLKSYIVDDDADIIAFMGYLGKPLGPDAVVRQVDTIARGRNS